MESSRSTATEEQSTTLREAFLETQLWGLFGRGLFAVVFGVLVYLLGERNLTVFLSLLASYVFVDGLFVLLAASDARRYGVHWVSFALEAILEFTTALVVVGLIVVPGVLTEQRLLVFVAVWAIGTGLLELVGAFLASDDARFEPAGILLAVAGIASVLLGAVLLVLPNIVERVGLVEWLVGTYAVFTGVVYAVLFWVVSRPTSSDTNPVKGDAEQGSETDENFISYLDRRLWGWWRPNWSHLSRVRRLRYDLQNYMKATKSCPDPIIQPELKRRVEAALYTLDEAEQAIYERELASFWESYYEAVQKEIRIRARLEDCLEEHEGRDERHNSEREKGDEDAINREDRKNLLHASRDSWMLMQAKQVKIEADDALPVSQRRLVTELLADTEGKITDVSVYELTTALLVLHQNKIEQFVKRNKVKLQIWVFGVSAVLALAAIAIIFAYFGVTCLPLDTAMENGTEPEVDILNREIYYVPVLLFGILGASISGLLSLSETLTKKRLTGDLVTIEASVTRLIAGGVGSIIIFLTIRSGLINLGTLFNCRSAFVIAFVSGFSERLFLRTLEHIEAQLPGDTSDEEASPKWLERDEPDQVVEKREPKETPGTATNEREDGKSGDDRQEGGESKRSDSDEDE